MVSATLSALRSSSALTFLSQNERQSFGARPHFKRLWEIFETDFGDLLRSYKNKSLKEDVVYLVLFRSSTSVKANATIVAPIAQTLVNGSADCFDGYSGTVVVTMAN